MLVRPRPISNACPAVNVYHIMHGVYISMSGYVQAHKTRETRAVATIQLGGPETIGIH